MILLQRFVDFEWLRAVEVATALVSSNHSNQRTAADTNERQTNDPLTD